MIKSAFKALAVVCLTLAPLALSAVAPGGAAIAKPLDVPGGTYALDPTHASVTWKVNHLGLSNYTARFTKFDATVDLNPEDLAQSSLTVTIDPKSVKTDYPFADKKDFDKKIAEDPEFLNANEHPEITFKSTAVEMLSDTTAKVIGELTMLGKTNLVAVDVTLNGAVKEHPFQKVPALGFSATTKIKRSEYGFTKYIPVVGDEVAILIEAEFLQK